ncbi:hypothetical protein [Providencia rettgeri]|nr:hypothetical protein [Providencia rettgeri]WIE06536.1 hypothetical protein N4838_011510 [Providencia rettgeri]
MMNDSQTPKNKVENTVEIDLNKIKLERDAENKAKKAKKYADAGFTRTKIYLGTDTYEKLAEIYQYQYGKKLNINGRKEIDKLSRVISYCINKVYEKIYIKNKDGQLPDILPADKPDSQLLYDLYQAAMYLEEQNYSTNKISKKMQNDGYPSPSSFTLYGARSRQNRWTVQQVEDLLDIKVLNQDIEDLNKPKRSKK